MIDMLLVAVTDVLFVAAIFSVVVYVAMVIDELRHNKKKRR